MSPTSPPGDRQRRDTLRQSRQALRKTLKAHEERRATRWRSSPTPPLREVAKICGPGLEHEAGHKERTTGPVVVVPEDRRKRIRWLRLEGTQTDLMAGRIIEHDMRLASERGL